MSATRMKNRRRTVAIWLTSILPIIYIGLYFALRFSGYIAHCENRGVAIGHTVRAQVSEWNDIGPHPLAAMERATVKAVNLIYVPLRCIEKSWHER